MANAPFNSKFPRGATARTFSNGKGSVFGNVKTLFSSRSPKTTFSSVNVQTFSTRHPTPPLGFPFPVPQFPRKGD